MKVHINGNIEEVSELLNIEKEDILKPNDFLYKLNDRDFIARNIIVAHCGQIIVDMQLEEVIRYGKKSEVQ